MSNGMSTEFHATTICAVQRDGKTAIAGDGQVTMGNAVIMKGTAQKSAASITEDHQWFCRLRCRRFHAL